MGSKAEDEGAYLDWNATTPPHPEVLAAMTHASAVAWGNPASVHGTGRRARLEVEELREALARALGVHARDVVLTSGGTEANNLALAQAPGLVTSRLEHPSVVRVADALAASGRPVRWLSVSPGGRLDSAELREACRDMPAGSWVAVQAANHETGVLQPIAELALPVHEAGLRFHVDAVQAFGKVDCSALAAADSIAIASHKIRGPKGIGALAFRGRAPKPLLLGGTQERGLRPGTVDAVAAAGFRAALRLAAEGPARWGRLAVLRDALEAALTPLAVVNGSAPRLPHVSNLSFSGQRGDELVAALDLYGVSVSSGSACAAGTAEASPVITAMGGRERALGALRISFGDATPPESLTLLKDLLFQLVGGGVAKGSRSP
jgi:cysteine desulfurase